MNSRKKVDVLISGNGPAALAVAFKAIKCCKSVLMVSDKKDEYLRVQRVYVDHYNRMRLLALSNADSILNEEDEKIIHSLIHNMTLQIKDIERYMKRRLNESNNKTNL